MGAHHPAPFHGAVSCQRHKKGCFSYQLRGKACSFPSLLAPSHSQSADASTVSVCSCHPGQTSGTGRSPPCQHMLSWSQERHAEEGRVASQVSPATRRHSTHSPLPHLTSAVTESHPTTLLPCSCCKAEPANNLEITRSFMGSHAGLLPHSSILHRALSRAHKHTDNTSCFNL